MKEIPEKPNEIPTPLTPKEIPDFPDRPEENPSNAPEKTPFSPEPEPSQQPEKKLT